MSNLTDSLKVALAFEGEQIPHKYFPIYYIERDENGEENWNSIMTNRYLKNGVKLARLAPLHEKLIAVVAAAEAECAKFRFPEEDRPILHEALDALRREIELK